MKVLDLKCIFPNLNELTDISSSSVEYVFPYSYYIVSFPHAN